MSRHRGPDYHPDFIGTATTPIPVNAEVRSVYLQNRTRDLEDQLLVWQHLNSTWGDINGLIETLNNIYYLNGSTKEIPKGLA